MFKQRKLLVVRHRRKTPPRGMERIILAKGDLVAAAAPFMENGKDIPMGAIGVVTHVFAQALCYEVKFVEPLRISACVDRSQLEFILAKIAMKKEF